MVAALYVIKNGPYYGIPDVDPWDEERDARKYAGPWPVVAHPPCARWGRYATVQGKKIGNDDGCFASALLCVRVFGGVLEHPANSHAWQRFGISRPSLNGGWVLAGDGYGWTCCVEQGRYGHAAKKATWLYAVGTTLPSLRWGVTPPDFTLSQRQRRTGICQRLSHRQRAVTPQEFAELLLNIARSCNAWLATEKDGK